MSKLIATNKGGGDDFEIIPQDTHLAVCYQIVDVGTHLVKDIKTDKERSVRKIRIAWELPEVRGEFEQDGEMKDLPRVISNEYTFSLSPRANLFKDLQKWRGRDFTKEELDGFDMENVLGKGCYLTVIHREVKKQDGSTRTYANVGGIMKVPKGVDVPPPEYETTLITLQDIIENGGNIPESVPAWVAEKIKQSEEYRGFMGGSPSTASVPQDDDELDTPPF